jgi:membrane associated rhomboid family serine protease
MNSIFSNLAPVTKNLLIINVLFFVATFVLQQKGIFLREIFSAHNPDSPLFQPYQVITHFFMHGSFQHILFNMIGLILFGSMLERVWDGKRFLIFYVACALGSFFIYIGYSWYEMLQLKSAIIANSENINELRNYIIQGKGVSYSEAGSRYFELGTQSMLGASGAVYGLMIGAAVLFPNTELMLMIPPIPLKLKYLAIGLLAIAVYSHYKDNPNDTIAHLAHIGGALTGFVLVKIWNKDKTRFY